MMDPANGGGVDAAPLQMGANPLRPKPKKSRERDRLPVLKGYLNKQDSNIFHTWSENYFALEKDQLFYYKTERDLEHQGFIDLSKIKEIKLGTGEGTSWTFNIVTPERTFYFQAFAERERKFWVYGLRAWMIHFGFLSPPQQKRKNRKSQSLYVLPVGQSASGEPQVLPAVPAIGKFLILFSTYLFVCLFGYFCSIFFNLPAIISSPWLGLVNRCPVFGNFEKDKQIGTDSHFFFPSRGTTKAQTSAGEFVWDCSGEQRRWWATCEQRASERASSRALAFAFAIAKQRSPGTLLKRRQASQWHTPSS